MIWLDRFRALLPPSSAGSFRLGETICPGCRIAASHLGELALVIDVSPTGQSSPRRLEHLVYEPPQPLEVHADGKASRVENLAVLVCRAKEETLQNAFLRIAITQLQTSGPRLTEAELESRLEELVTLFRALGKPASQTIQGLWSELAIVLWSADPRLAIASWHSGSRALHDFAAGADRLEVKSCATGMREHALRLEQLQEAPGGRTLFASLLVQESEDGSTVSDLCEAILVRVDNNLELKRRLEAIVTQSLGRDWRLAATRRFDLEDARNHAHFYDAPRIPRVPQPLPAEVKHVSFVVDLSTTDAMALNDARELGPFFRGMLPPEA